MYTHINKNNPIPNLRPNHHKHTNTNEYKHQLIGTHRCSNQNPQIPKSKITNTDLMPKSNPNPHKSEPITAIHISDLNPPQPHHKSEPHTHPHPCLKNQNPITTSQIRTLHPQDREKKKNFDRLGIVVCLGFGLRWEFDQQMEIYGFLFLGINLCMYENGGVGLKKKERRRRTKKKKHWISSEEEGKKEKERRRKKKCWSGSEEV